MKELSIKFEMTKVHVDDHWVDMQGRSARVSAVSKAIDRLPSKKRSMREATLAWLESAARTREPEYLQLSSHTELLPILKAAQDPAVRPCFDPAKPSAQECPCPRKSAC